MRPSGSVGALTIGLILVLLPSVCSALRTTVRPEEVILISNPENAREQRVVIRYSMPQDLVASEIIYAQLSGKVSAVAREGEGVVHVQAAPITTEWSASTISWTDPWTRPGGDFDDALTGIFLVKDGLHSFRIDLTRTVLEWIGGQRDNFGIMLGSADGFEGRFSLPTTEGGLATTLRAPVIKIWYLPRAE